MVRDQQVRRMLGWHDSNLCDPVVIVEWSVKRVRGASGAGEPTQAPA